MIRFKKIKILLLVLIAFLVVSVTAFSIHSRTFSDFLIAKNLISNFYPEGPANQYKAVNVISPGEDHRIWKFRLNSKEAENVNGELYGGIWQLLTADGCKYINKAFFDGNLFEYAETDEIYYCLYDLENEWYKNIGMGNGTLHGEENILFVYNKTTTEYYCVSKIS